MQNLGMGLENLSQQSQGSRIEVYLSTLKLMAAVNNLQWFFFFNDGSRNYKNKGEKIEEEEKKIEDRHQESSHMVC